MARRMFVLVGPILPLQTERYDEVLHLVWMYYFHFESYVSD